MNDAPFSGLEAVVADDRFPEVDLQLRRGRHIGREDGLAYEFVADAQPFLEELYRRYGCELVRQSDGYFYLLPSNDRLGRRRLTVGEMLVGQTAALLYLDPATLQHHGVVARDAILQRLAALIGADALVRAFHPRKRRVDERVAAEAVRGQTAEALRRLADLGFVDSVDDAHVRLRPALLRFAEPVRGVQDRLAALEKLVARGEAAFGDEPADEEPRAEDEPAS
ncbi:MAG TPA: chromosome partition protein MukE [Planctomycetota bacterium]|nr:chromosome partition protein MukE [Planctomycetota bacterium]